MTNRITDIKRTLIFATEAHVGQYRKQASPDGEPVPYIMHPIAVALAAGQWGLPREIQQVCLLHDVLEHTKVTKQELVDRFDSYIADVVEQLTNPSHKPEHRNKPRAERKRIDREHLAKISQYGKIVKMLDRTDNLQDLNGVKPEFKNLYLAESKELFKVLQDAHWRIANEFMEEICRLDSSV